MAFLTLLFLAGLATAQSMDSMSMSGMSMSMSMPTPSMSMPMSSSMSGPALITATAMSSTPQRIAVGSPEGGLVFQPNVVFASPGSVLEFHFYPRNHSVVQGPYDTPCKPLPTGVYSGFIPSMMGEAQSIFSVTVNNTDPIWLYCSQGEHCQEGMDMVVNPPSAGSGQTLEGYLAAARDVDMAESLGAVQGGVVSMQGGGMGGGMATPTPTPGGMGGSGGGSMSGGGGSGGGSGMSTGAAPMLGEPKGLIAGAVVALAGWFL